MPKIYRRLMRSCTFLTQYFCCQMLVQSPSETKPGSVSTDTVFNKVKTKYNVVDISQSNHYFSEEAQIKDS